MKFIIFSLVFWGLAIAASLYGQTDLRSLIGENLFSLNFFLLLLPYPVWYARSAIAGRKLFISTPSVNANLILSIIFILICSLVITLLCGDILVFLFGWKSDIPILDMETTLYVIGFLIIWNLASCITATFSLRAVERHLGIRPVFGFLTFLAFFYLPIGMFFLKSRLAELKPNTTFD